MSVTLNGTSGLTFNDATTQNTSAFYGGLGFRNRIINGAMMIDQRNAGASVTLNDGIFPVDRFQGSCSATGKMTAQQSSTAPTGFSNSVLITSSSAYSVGSGDIFAFTQKVEGFNVADLGWGAVGASTVTLSFWVRSSLTGTFGGTLQNSARDRNYPFTYTISSANTWEQKTITITGDTSGTWLKTNGVGVQINFGLGVGSTYSGTSGSWASGNIWSATGATSVVGTNGATFYITGVQLEKGSTATSFDYRPYGTELALCQRYFATSYSGSAVGTATTTNACYLPVITTGNYQGLAVVYPVSMRSSPTVTSYSPATGTSGKFRNATADVTTAPILGSLTSGFIYASGVLMNAATDLYAHYTASAEL